MKLQDKLKELREQGKAVLAANFYNLETLQAVVSASAGVGAPVVLQVSESSIRYMGLHMAVVIARKALEEWGVEGWLHLDHGSSLGLVQQCLDAGFDSVMIDASEFPLEENIRISREAVRKAEPYGACVEAELGYIAKLHQEQDGSGFTQPGDAVRFTKETGVHALAVSIGSAHGFYREKPSLDLDLLARIRKAVETPLVLHGSSGIPDAILVRAMENGICKINLATETKNIFMTSLKKELADSEEIDLRIVFPKATQAARELIEKKLKVVHQIR